MGRGGGEELNFTEILEAPEGVHQVAAVPLDEGVAHPEEELFVQGGQGLELGLVAGADNLAARELDVTVEPYEVPVAEQGVEQHGGQRGGERHGQTEIDVVFD